MFKKFQKLSLALAALLVGALAWAATQGTAVKEARSWDFTKGAEYLALFQENTDLWSEVKAGNIQRYQNNVAFDNVELSEYGLAGIYITAAEKAFIYDNANKKCVQASGAGVTFRIPNCAKGDKLIFSMCSADKSNHAFITSDNLSEEIEEAATGATERTATVKEDGDVTFLLKGSKGARIFSVAIEPAAGEPAEPQTAEWTDFDIDFYTSDIITEEERVQWQEIPDFGLAVDKDGKVTRVAADDASAVAVLKGYKWHGDHGVVPGTMEVKVAGTTRVTFGCCTYGGNVKVTSEAGSFVIESNKQCYKNDPANVASGIYVGEATTLTITGGDYVRYYKFEACEAPKEPVAFQDFEMILNNENGTILTAEEVATEQTEYEFGVAVEDGKTVRVEKDADNALATVSGKYWNDHGSVNVVVKTHVDGPVKVTFGNCTFYGGVYSLTADGKTISVDPSEKACWKGNHTSTTDLIYDGDAADITISAPSYCPYIKVAAYEPPAEPVVFRDFAVQVNNQDGTMLTADEQVQGTEFKFGVQVKADGTVKRVDADNANALAVVSGKFHSDHGSNNLKVVVPVDGKTKITFGNCTYNGGKFKVTPQGGETVEIEASEANCWKNGHESVTEYVYEGDATVLTVEGNSYTPYIAFEAIKSTAGSEYNDVAGTVSWTNGNEQNGTTTEAIDAAVLETSVRVGSALSVSGPKKYDQIPEATTPLMCYLTGSNLGTDVSGLIEYKVKVKKGLTFTPSDVEFDLVKEGTDNCYITWSYAIDGVAGDTVAYSSPKTQIRRNNNNNPDAPLTHKETIKANDGGREFLLRFYVSNAANKGMGIGNIKINGTVNGVEEVRAFQNIAINFQSNPYTVRKPESGLPEGVVVGGIFHDGTHGYENATITLPVDGPVKFTIGNCAYNGFGLTVTKGDPTSSEAAPDVILDNLNCVGDCSSTTTWYYNSEEPAILNLTLPQYCPSFTAEACELLPNFEVSYFDTDGTLLSKEDVQGGTNLEFKYKAEDLKIGEGQAFRGWFNSDKEAAIKIKEGTMVQENLKLYARATDIEVPTSTSRYIYDLTKSYFYVEDHEAIEIQGHYYNTHGWLIDKGGTIKVLVAGKSYITVGNCLYSGESMAVATDEAGNQIAEFQVKATGDGAEYTFQYDGEPGWITITFPEGAYTHSVAVWNVVNFVAYDETTGYYVIPSGDVSSFLIALKAASGQPGTKIFLPNGTYDLGETVLTGVSGKDVSIIGESMEGTIIVNAPLLENEGIGQTATLKNSCEGLYMQDLTLRNAMKFNGGTGRAVTLQDCGTKTICKNVSLESYQDTYYSNNNNGDFYFEDGEIHGVVDYVCGGGDVFYNRVKFVNEKIKNTTIAAPASAKKYGYVMMNCTIETLCNEFNYGRSWQNPSRLAWINTTINQPEKLAASRFTIGGMNVAADKFVEYNTMDKDGNVISPASNVIEFTHSTGNKKYETILTADEAAEYAIEKVFPDWRAEEIAAQVKYVDGEVTEGNVYLVDGKIYANELPAGAGLKIRKANGRGGFGPVVVADNITDGIKTVAPAKAKAVKAIYNLAGQRVGKNYSGAKVVVYTDGTSVKVAK